MKNIWMYWEGELPEHIAQCIESVVRRKGSLDFHLLDAKSVAERLPDLPPAWHGLKKAAHKADYVRTRLVHRYGGMWIDCDMVALAALEPLFNFPAELDYACQNLDASIGCFIARPGCRILERVIADQAAIVADRPQAFGWNDIGNSLLKKHGQGYAYHRWPEWFLDEIAGGQTRKLFSRTETLEANVSGNAVLFHLCNEGTGQRIQRELRPGRLMRSDKLISKLFRKAFDLPEPGRAGPAWLEDLKDRDFMHRWRH